MAISTQGIKMTIPGILLEEQPLQVKIKSFPDLGAAPAAIEVTSLDDTTQKFIPGVKGLAAMEFVGNYEEDVFQKLLENENSDEDLSYNLTIGEKTFTIKGKHNVLVVGGGLNAAVDMKLVIVPSEAITAA